MEIISSSSNTLEEQDEIEMLVVVLLLVLMHSVTSGKNTLNIHTVILLHVFLALY